MLEGDPPLSNLEPYEAAKSAAGGLRPVFRAKSYSPELREYVNSTCISLFQFHELHHMQLILFISKFSKFESFYV